MPKPQTIRAAVVAAKDRLGLTAYAIARQTNGAVSDDMLRLYLTGKSDLTSEKLDAVLRVLKIGPPRPID